MNDQTLPRSPWLILTFLCIPVFIGSVDLTIVSAILPEVIVSLGLPPESRLDDAFWMITAYLLAYTVCMVFVGRLSDIIGRRWVYIAFLLLFMFGSYWVAVAHTFPADWYARLYREIYPDARPPAEELRILYMIIFGRILQAIGAGAMAPATMAMVADLFPPENRARQIGLVGAIDTVGWMLGHLYGGIMVNYFGNHGDEIVRFFAEVGITISHPDWRTLFWFNLVVGVITLVAIIITLWGIPQPRLKERFDFLGTALIVFALIALNLGLGTSSPESIQDTSSFQAAQENSTGFALPLIAASVIAFALFLVVEIRSQYPLFNLSLFRQRNVWSAALVNLGIGFTLTISLVAMPILVNIREAEATIEGIQDAALLAGLLLSALTVPMALAAIPGGWLSDRYGYRLATMTGLGFSLVGFMLIAITWRSDTSYEVMAAQMMLAGIGLGLTISPIGAAVINAAQDSERGAASALVLALRLTGMTVALSSLTDFAINRVNNLVQERSQGVTDTGGLYLLTTVDVTRELFLLGAVVTVITLGVAWGLHGGQSTGGQKTHYL